MTLAGDIPTPHNASLVANVTHFARALRKAGLPIGTGRIMDAIRAIQTTGFARKPYFYWALHACFVSRSEHRIVFAQVFGMFWRDPEFLEDMMAILMPAARRAEQKRKQHAAEKRAADALLDGTTVPHIDAAPAKPSQMEFDATMTFSDMENLRSLDFEQMTMAEMNEAKRMIAKIQLPVQPLASRRNSAAARGQIVDWRNTMRRAIRNGGEIHDFSRRKRLQRWPNLVALCDISGSMSAYSRAILHFLHAASNEQGAGWAQVHSFTFGTRLTNITRQLRHRDVDAALDQAGSEAKDWEGGTRIGDCLHDFNRQWARRVLGQGAVILLISDGLDRDEPGKLSKEMERLKLSARKVIWLNPLLRWDGFAPKARGIREMLPHVDSFRAGHNIASLQELSIALSRPDDIGEKVRLMQMLKDT